jgi:hypothetical protein
VINFHFVSVGKSGTAPHQKSAIPIVIAFAHATTHNNHTQNRGNY